MNHSINKPSANLDLQKNHPYETKHRLVTKILKSVLKGPQLYDDCRKIHFLQILKRAH